VRKIVAIGRVAASIAAVALITALYSEVLRVNPTTVALSYLIAILLIASTWGIDRPPHRFLPSCGHHR
jgi:hypothetical protein